MFDWLDESLAWLQLHPRVQGLVLVIAATLGAIVVYWIVKASTKQLGRLAVLEREPLVRSRLEQRARTVASIVNNLAKAVLGAFVLLLALRKVGLDITPLLAGAGILSVAIGFGAQSLIKDFFAGFFIVFENQFGIGDQVTIAGHTGTVERMTLRVTVLRDVEGNVHFVPNGRIDTVTVQSREWARAVIDMTVPYTADLSDALAVTTDVALRYAEENPDSVVEPPETLGVQDLGPRGVSLRVVLKTPPGKNLAAGRELRRRMKLAFDLAGIQFAHSSEDGSPPPIVK
jgi:moderate conductance mechanosensitive channel